MSVALEFAALLPEMVVFISVAQAGFKLTFLPSFLHLPILELKPWKTTMTS